ncbi:hypothetical protein [Egbenema bharatensis]|uniref:hypothetical protein n=1 Tax=Egbenema bharatensis TaxID=3463334 RepID=UPI003A83809F
MVKEVRLKKSKKNFSSFTLKEAMKQLHITDLYAWEINAPSLQPSDFFQQRLKRLEAFDLQSYERSKELLIDAFCEEAIQTFSRLKIWKGAGLEGENTIGSADYLIAERKRYLEAPLLCIVEAKKDDFEQGLAQCLVEMQACQWQNAQIDQAIDILGIVTNGSLWQFYKLLVSGQVYETLPYGLNDLPAILGALHFVFQECEQNLN